MLSNGVVQGESQRGLGHILWTLGNVELGLGKL